MGNGKDVFPVGKELRARGGLRKLHLSEHTTGRVLEAHHHMGKADEEAFPHELDREGLFRRRGLGSPDAVVSAKTWCQTRAPSRRLKATILSLPATMKSSRVDASGIRYMPHGTTPAEAMARDVRAPFFSLSYEGAGIANAMDEQVLANPSSWRGTRGSSGRVDFCTTVVRDFLCSIDSSRAKMAAHVDRTFHCSSRPRPNGPLGYRRVVHHG